MRAAMVQMGGSRSRRALGDQGRVPGAIQPGLVLSGKGHGLPGQARGAWEDTGSSGDCQEAEYKVGQDTSLRPGHTRDRNANLGSSDFCSSVAGQS